MVQGSTYAITVGTVVPHEPTPSLRKMTRVEGEGQAEQQCMFKTKICCLSSLIACDLKEKSVQELDRLPMFKRRY